MRSRLARRPALLGAIAVLALGAVAFINLMSHSALRRTATNGRVIPIHVDLPPGNQLCQPEQHVPAGTGYVVLSVGVMKGETGAPLAVTIRRGNSTYASGRAQGGYGNVPLLIRLSPVRHALDGMSVCARNLGHTTVSFFGDYGTYPGTLTSDAPIPVPTVLRVDWFGSKPQSWWQLTGTVADRFGLVKAPFFGTWTFWAALVLLLAISAAAIRVVVREPAA